MNNKGFAISTVIYGLSIMGVLIISILMGIMSTSRANTKKLSKSIEDELTRFSKTDTSFSASTSATPTAQEYIVPNGQSGWYLIELWGAQGGPNGGYGAYTSGVIHLQEGEVLYFYIGKKRSGSTSGFSTDVRLLNGNYDNNDNASKRSYETRIMVAAGGGSAAGADGGTLYGYSNSMRSLGGKIRVKATTGYTNDYNLIPTSLQSTTNGTLAGYPASYAKSTLTHTSTAPKPHQNGSTGGDGYTSSASAAIGGTSFISGYAGSNAYVRGVASNNPKYKYCEYIYDAAGAGTYDADDECRDYYFYDGKMIAGVNAGDGRAKISRVVEETDTVKKLPKKNQKMINVRQVRDCLATTNASANMVWNKMEVIVEGNNVAKGKSLTDATKTGYSCKVLNLGGSFDVDEIAVWHKDGVDYQNHTIEVYDGSAWKWLKAPGSGTSLSETENVTGARVSAYQADYTQKLPNSGDYYIFPVLSESKVLTAHATSETESDPISVAFINGQKRQSWSIELIDESLRTARGKTDEYKIIELARYKSLEIYLDENIIGNQVKANTRFNSYGTTTGSKGHDPEIWKVVPLGNGTYQIVTVVPIFDASNPSGNLCAQTNSEITENYGKVLIGRTNLATARFKFVSISY